MLSRLAVEDEEEEEEVKKQEEEAEVFIFVRVHSSRSGSRLNIRVSFQTHIPTRVTFMLPS